MIIASVDVRTGERHIIETPPNRDIPQEANHRGKLEANRNRPHLTVIDRDNFYFALTPECDRLAPIHDL